LKEARFGTCTVYLPPEGAAEKLNPFAEYVTPVTVVPLPEDVTEPLIVTTESGVLASRSAVTLASPAGAETTIGFAGTVPVCQA